MKTSLSVLLICIFLSAGCSMKVVPVQVESGVIDEKNFSQTLSRDNVSVTAGSAESQLYNYNLDGAVSAFSVVIENRGSSELPVDPGMFLLMDNEGKQYVPLTPDKVKEIISRDSYYLIPYPYVGFYYLEDYEKSSFYNTFTSEKPYYFEVYPQDIYTKALAVGTLIPKAKMSGLVYFKIDLHGKKDVKLLVYKQGTSKSSPADFTFPFKIQ
ncbi:hypothetical protein [Geotalea sp. SG265]|uniref:hypothetical protein n=1 Tax=Geotalea sp. SG265 TaxID=2922867 RepID=UPI001FAECA7D|nr:hypothetical protein [Geotalea sp. SG265]